MIASSSSAPVIEPIETTLTTPDPMLRSSGANRAFPVSVVRATTLPATPSILGIENPPMSASSTPTVRPRCARRAARLTVTDDFPTPPLPEAMATIRQVAGIVVSGAFSRAFQRARDMTSRFCSLVISPKWTRTAFTPGRVPTLVFTSFMSWARSGQPAVVSATVMATLFSVSISMRWTMPRSTTLSPSSGSITPRSALRVASSAGASTVTVMVKVSNGRAWR